MVFLVLVEHRLLSSCWQYQPYNNSKVIESQLRDAACHLSGTDKSYMTPEVI